MVTEKVQGEDLGEGNFFSADLQVKHTHVNLNFWGRCLLSHWISSTVFAGPEAEMQQARLRKIVQKIIAQDCQRDTKSVEILCFAISYPLGHLDFDFEAI